MQSFLDFEKSIALSEKALEMDPRSILIIQNLGQSYYHVRNYERALILANRSLAIDAIGLNNNWAKLNTLFLSGDLNQARALSQTIDMEGAPFNIRFAYMSGNPSNIKKTLSFGSSTIFKSAFEEFKFKFSVLSIKIILSLLLNADLFA